MKWRSDPGARTVRDSLTDHPLLKSFGVACLVWLPAFYTLDLLGMYSLAGRAGVATLASVVVGAIVRLIIRLLKGD